MIIHEVGRAEVLLIGLLGASLSWVVLYHGGKTRYCAFLASLLVVNWS